MLYLLYHIYYVLIAYGNLDKNNNPDVNIVIPTIPIQDPTYEQNNHQEIPSQIPFPLLIPKFKISTSNIPKSTDHQLDKNTTNSRSAVQNPVAKVITFVQR